MTVITTTRHVDLSAFSFAATMRTDGAGFAIEADVDEPTLQSAIDAAPDVSVAETNEATLEQAVTDQLTALRAIRDSSNLPASVREMATAQIRFVRLLVGLLDGTT